MKTLLFIIISLISVSVYSQTYPVYTKDCDRFSGYPSKYVYDESYSKPNAQTSATYRKDPVYNDSFYPEYYRQYYNNVWCKYIDTANSKNFTLPSYDGILRWISNNINTSEKMRVECTVDKDGSVIDVLVTLKRDGERTTSTAEVYRTINAKMPKWKPATLNGKPVACKTYFIINK